MSFLTSRKFSCWKTSRYESYEIVLSSVSKICGSLRYIMFYISLLCSIDIATEEAVYSWSWSEPLILPIGLESSPRGSIGGSSKCWNSYYCLNKLTSSFTNADLPELYSLYWTLWRLVIDCKPLWQKRIWCPEDLFLKFLVKHHRCICFTRLTTRRLFHCVCLAFTEDL